MADLFGIHLALPIALLLLPLPLLVRRLLPPQDLRQEVPYLPDAVASAGRPPPERPFREGVLPLRAGFWLCLVLALAGPERLVSTPDRSATGRDIMLALDLSGSMETPDFTLDGETATRLAAVKRVATRFVTERQGDRIGVVIFADRAYVAAPLTYDLTAVARAIDAAEIGLTGRSTAIAEGLGLALKRITAEPANARVIVLLSDGRDTTARMEARDVGRLAGGMGVRVHTIALGPEDLETRPAARDAVDIAALRDIAEASGGRSWRVRDIGDLVAMAGDLDRLEPNPTTRPPVVLPQPLWYWPAAAGFALALLIALEEAMGRPLRLRRRAASGTEIRA